MTTELLISMAENNLKQAREFLDCDQKFCAMSEIMMAESHLANARKFGGEPNVGRAEEPRMKPNVGRANEPGSEGDTPTIDV